MVPRWWISQKSSRIHYDLACEISTIQLGTLAVWQSSACLVASTVMAAFDFADVPDLCTDRLRLRRIVASDLPAWAEIWNSPQVMRYMIDFETMPDDSEVWSIIEWADRIFRQKTGIRWAVTLKPSDRMIGSCGFHLYDPRHRWLEIGYELHHDFWRQGIMSEAVDALLQFCFDCLAAHRIEANVTVGNEASAGLLKALGFTLEGTWRERVYWRGEFHSLWQFSLLAPEYRARITRASGALN